MVRGNLTTHSTGAESACLSSSTCRTMQILPARLIRALDGSLFESLLKPLNLEDRYTRAAFCQVRRNPLRRLAAEEKRVNRAFLFFRQFFEWHVDTLRILSMFAV